MISQTTKSLIRETVDCLPHIDDLRKLMFVKFWEALERIDEDNEKGATAAQQLPLDDKETKEYTK